MVVNLLLCIICCLPSCNFIAPKKKIPTHNFNNTFAHQCHASAAEPIYFWWQQFNNETLNELVKQALKSNYTLKIAVEKIEEFRARYQFKQAELFPQIDGVLEANKNGISNRLIQTSFIQKNTVSFFRFGFDAFWEIDFWGKIRQARDAQKYALYAQIEDMHFVYISLIADVVQTYNNLCILTAKKSLQASLATIEQKLTNLEQDLLCAGITNEVVVTQQQQALSQAYVNYLETEKNLTQSYHALAFLLGQQPEELSCLSSTALLPTLTISAVGAPSDLLRRRPDIRAAENELARTYELIGSAIAQWFPSVTLFGSTSTTADTSSQWFGSNSLTWSIGPEIHWPILHFGRISATIKERESKKRQAALYYSNTIINALKEVEDALVGHCTAQQQCTLLHKKVSDALHEESLLKDLVQSGLSDLLSLLRIQKTRIKTEIELLETQQTANNYLIALYKALGGGW